MKANLTRKFVSFAIAVIMVISTITVHTEVKAASYKAEKITVKGKVGKKVVLKPVVYKNGVKVNLKEKGYSVLWSENCKHYGGLVNGGVMKTMKKLKAEDCYNSSYKKEYSYIVLYKDEEVVRGTARILSKGKVKVEKVKIKSLKLVQEEEQKSLILKCKKTITTTGMEVLVSKDSKFQTSKKKKSLNATTIYLDGIEAGNTYYVKVRGFVTINKKKKYGKWSKVAKVEVPVKE